MIKIPKGSQKDIDGTWLTPEGDTIMELNLSDEDLKFLKKIAKERFGHCSDKALNQVVVDALEAHMKEMKREQNLKESFDDLIERYPDTLQALTDEDARWINEPPVGKEVTTGET